MPVTSSTAKVKFYIGSFDYDSTLTLPATTLENKLTLRFDEFVSDQLTNWGSAPLEIYGLLRVTFEGEEIYKNEDYDATSELYPPSNPDITITPDTDPATVETVVVNNYIAMVTGTDGTVSNGEYIVEVKFAYWFGDTLYELEDETAFTANLNYERQEPVVSNWYDQDLPKLTLTDAQDYTWGGVTATYETEFVLSPPQNRTELTDTFTDIQTASYPTFWTGGNEMTYTILIDYEFTSYVTTTAEQDYSAFTIYYMDWCTTYDCLNELYELAIGANCGTKQKEIYNERWAQATSLIQQIQLGLGCGKDTLSGLITELNTVLDCECGCLDSTPRQIGADNIVPNDQVQTVNATTDSETIDLSAGSTMIVSLANTESGDSQFTVTNITQYATYRMVFTRAFGSQIASFDSSIFFDADGAMGSVTPLLANKIIVDFFATDATTLTMISRSDA